LFIKKDMSTIFDYILFVLMIFFVSNSIEQVTGQYNGGRGTYRRFDGLARVYGPNYNFFAGQFGGGQGMPQPFGLFSFSD